MGCRPPGLSAHGILQARMLGWVAMPAFRGSSWPRGWTCVSSSSCFGKLILYHWAPGKPILKKPIYRCVVLQVRSWPVSHESKTWMWKGLPFSLKALGEDWFFLPFPVSRSHLHSLAWGPFLHLQSCQWGLSSPTVGLRPCFCCWHGTSLSLAPSPSPPLFLWPRLPLHLSFSGPVSLSHC